jgi:RimJ/RimL family protein N-acetyltransferase
MRIDGRFTYLDNHTLANLDTMYKWSQDKDLISLEGGSLKKIIDNKDQYKRYVMASLIENNHEAHSCYCNFGIYSRSNDELVGYLDFQNIDFEKMESELSLSIPDLDKRNRLYGFDAFLNALKYAFEIRELRIIVIQTRVTNKTVLSIAKKLKLESNKSSIIQDDEKIELAKYLVKKTDYLNIRNLTNASTG